ncbi:MAG: dTDP-glucose 4,6-dehydratase [Polyangiaceae bacterium]
MRILVTGAFGYVGGRVARALRQRGAEVVLSGRSVPSKARWARDFDVRIGDLAAGNVSSLAEGIDVLVHLAALPAGMANADPTAAFAVSALATRKLIGECLNRGATRFIFASTAAVYGPNPLGSVTELTRTCASDAYSACHLAGEAFCNEANRIAGRPFAVALRLANVYGVAVTEPERGSPVHNDLCRLAAREGTISLRSSGEQSRDLVWIEDVAQAIWLTATTPDARMGEPLFNLGGGLRMTVAELAERVAAIAGHRLGKQVEVRRPRGEPLPGFDYSIERLSRLGYRPSVRLDEETNSLLTALLGAS